MTAMEMLQQELFIFDWMPKTKYAWIMYR